LFLGYLWDRQDYILTPGRYVGIEEQEDDGEPFEEKMTRLTAELSGLFAKSHELEQEIRERLGEIGGGQGLLRRGRLAGDRPGMSCKSLSTLCTIVTGKTPSTKNPAYHD